MEDFTILGFNGDASKLIFKKDGEWIYIKHTLPKNELVAMLNIHPEIIDKNLRNRILNEARIKGRKKIAYSLDGKNIQKNYHFKLESDNYGNYRSISRNYSHLVSIEDYDQLPEYISIELIEDYKQQKEKKNQEKIISV